MTLSPAWLDELRARTLLSGLIGKTTKLQRAGREWKACCPFHNEKTPSFTINDDKGFYHCFGCGAHGDAIRWMTEQRGLPFIDAVKELAQAAGLEVPQQDPHAREKAERASTLHDVMAQAEAWFVEQLGRAEGAHARAYLQKRGISEALARTFRIGFAPDTRSGLRSALKEAGDEKLVECGLLIRPEEGQREPYDRFRGRLMIPIRDARGRTIAFGGRILGGGEPKYLNSPETALFDKGRTLFNLDRAAAASRKAGRVIVVEGYMDVIALAGAGIDEAVAPLGTALTEGQIERLWRLSDTPIICFDGDAAGRKASLRAALRALPMVGPGRSFRFALLPGGLDPDDLIAQAGLSAFEAELEKPVALDQLIWDHEFVSADTTTPEGRGALGKKLRDHAKSIIDNDVRLLYLGLFKQRHHDIFNADQFSNSRVTQSGRWLRRKASASPELLAIKDFGTSKTLFAPAALSGLRRFPAVISSHAEIVSYLPTLLMHRDLRLVCEEMVTAALSYSPLETDKLEAILKTAGLGPQLDRMESRRRVPFSFIRAKGDPEAGKRDLASVLEILAATPEIQTALEAATAALQRQADEEAFAEQVRLHVVKERLVSELADLLRRQSEFEQAGS